MLHPPSLEDQGARRLQVNRIAFVQYIVIEDLLPSLQSSGTLDADTCRELLSVGGRAEQAKALLNTLVSGKAIRRDWYHQLRLILKSSSQIPASRQREYDTLCHFMDNTVIFPSDVEDRKWNGLNPLPGIRSCHNDETSPSTESFAFDRATTIEQVSGEMSVRLRRSNERTKAIIKALRHWHPIFPADGSGSQTKLSPLFEEKRKSLKPYQKEEFFSTFKMSERKVFKIMQRIENVLALRLKDDSSLPTNPFYLCFIKPIDDMLDDTNNWLLYFKYLRHMEHRLLFPIIRELSSSFHTFTLDCGTPESRFNRKQLVRVGFLLCDFLRQYGRYDLALVAIHDIQRYLSQDEKLLQAWIPIFYGHAKAVDVLTENGMIREAMQEVEKAEFVLHRVNQLSLGKAVVDMAEYTAYQSQLSLVQGSNKYALNKAISALRLMDPDPDHKYVHFPVLRANVLAHIAIGHVSRAEKLALYLVQYAWKHFEGISLQYIQALQTFICMSNAFRKDDFGIIVARNCVQFAQLLLGQCDAPILAGAYAALAEALERRCRRNMSISQYSPDPSDAKLSSSQNSLPDSSTSLSKGSTTFSSEGQTSLEKSTSSIQGAEQKDQLLGEAVYWSEMALRTAKNCIPENHYALTLYRLLNVECSLAQCENLHGKKSENSQQLEEFVAHRRLLCEKELIYAISASQTALGEASIPLARSKRCLARIRLLQNQEKEALSLLGEVEKLLVTCLSSGDPTYLQYLVFYSKILRRFGETQSAVQYLDHVVKSLTSDGVYLSWMNEAYSGYIEALSEANQKQLCAEISQSYSEWLASHTVRLENNIDWACLHQPPPKDFFRKWDFWDPKYMLRAVDQLSQNLSEITEKQENACKERNMAEIANRALATTAVSQQASAQVLSEEEGTDDSDPDSSSSSDSELNSLDS